MRQPLLRRPLAPAGADQLRHLRLHQLLHHPRKRFTQEINALALKQVADDLLSRHPLRLGHRGDSSRQLHWREADDHERHGGRTPNRPRPTPSYTTLRDVTRSTRSRWRRLRISNQSRHSGRTVRTKRSAIAFAFGARTGVFTARMPSPRKTSSKRALYLLSRSRIRKRTLWSAKSRPRLRACWVTHSPVGFVVQPASQTARLACA